MGLAAKKFEHEYNATRIPKALEDLAKETKGATKNLQVEFDWQSFGDNQQAMDGAWSCWEQPLQGIAAVCSDDIGREAVQKGLKKVKIINMAEDAPAQVSFEGGVLTMRMYFANSTGSSPGYVEIQKVLENSLD